MVTTSSHTPQIRHIKRTLCIGIGGTGRDTLMRLRRFIIEHHGELSRLPVVSFLGIDTDEGALNSTGLPTGKTYRGKHLEFTPPEKVAITMDAQAVGALVQEFNHPAYGEGHFSHIEEWFPPALKDDVKVISGGANGIRPIGRLGFFHNFQKIQSAIQAAINRTVGHEQVMLQQNFQVDPGLDIFVIGSLCGGTGSGIFLDVAYTLRHLYPKAMTSFGYLVISPDLYTNDQTMQAGVYAALKELNYYTNAGTQFKACYDKIHQISVSEMKPPFDYPYLISSQTSGDHKVLKKEDLCNIISYKIYLEIAGEVGTKLRSDRAAIAAGMLNNCLHPFAMSQYFMTFGLSAIYFNRDRLLQIALNQVTVKLLGFWLTGHGQAPDAKDLLDRFLSKLNTEKQSEIFTARLAALTEDGGKTYAQYLATWNNKSLECENDDDVENLKQSLQNRFKSAFREVQPGQSDTIRGKWLTLAKNNQSKVLEDLKVRLDNFLQELLDADNVIFSLYNALSFLEAIRTKLDTYQYILEDKKQDMGSMKSQEDIDSIWLVAEQDIDDVKSKGWFPWSKKRDYQAITEIANKAVEKVKNLLKHNYDLFIVGISIEVAESLNKHIAQRLNQVTSLDNSLKQLQYFYKKEEEQLRSRPTEEIPGEAIFPEEEIEQLVPSNTERNKLAKNTHEVIDQLNNSLFALATTHNFSEGSIKDAIKTVLERNFTLQDATQTQSVVKRFLANYTLEQQAIALENVVRKSEALLDIFKKAPLFAGGVESFAVAFKSLDDGGKDPFRAILTDKLGIPPIHLSSIQSDSEILFIKEYGGFPLRLVNHLKQLKKVYEQQKVFGRVHNHAYIRFDDILPVEARIIENLEYLLYPCLAFNILSSPPQPSNSGTLSRASDISKQDCYVFSCYDSLTDEYYVAEISSDWRNALEQLVDRQDMVDILTKLLREEENKIKTNPNLLTSEYKPRIVRFIQQVNQLQQGDRNFIHKTKIIGQRATASTPAKEGVITRYLKRLEEQIQNFSTPVLPESHSSNQAMLPQTSENDP